VAVSGPRLDGVERLRKRALAKESAVKLKVYVVDLEIPARMKMWALRIGAFVVLAGTAAIAIAAVPKVWVSQETLLASDLNGNFSALDTRVSAIEGQERVQRAVLGSDGTISSQNGSWISTVSHSTGGYVITFASGVFSANPTCVVSPNAGNQISPSVECYSVSKTGMTCVSTSASQLTKDVGSPIDTALEIICVGPR
jgi:hypothetical protein